MSLNLIGRVLLPLCLAVTPCTGTAQADPAQQKEWGAMFGRIDAATAAYARRLGLADHWRSYCATMVSLEEERAPDNGLAPLGVTDWRTLDRTTFTTYLAALEAFKTSAQLLCLADVKARLKAAE